MTGFAFGPAFQRILVVATALLISVASAVAQPGVENVRPADLAALEEGLTLLAQGKAAKARGVFQAAEKADLHPMAGLLSLLAAAYGAGFRGPSTLQAMRNALDLLEEAPELARRQGLSKEDYEPVLEWTRSQHRAMKAEVPRLVRMLHCHLTLLSGEARVTRPQEPTPERIVSPQRIFTPMPSYTERARKARTTGVVVIRATVDLDGCFQDLETLAGLSGGLTQNAENALRWWVVQPASLDGRPVAAAFNWTVRFHLD